MARFHRALRLAPLAVLSPGPTLAGTPSKGVGKGGCEGFEDRSGYSPDFDPATVEGKPRSTWSRHSWDRAAATRRPETIHWTPQSSYPASTIIIVGCSSSIVRRSAAEIRFENVVQQGVQNNLQNFSMVRVDTPKTGHGEPPVSPNCACPVNFYLVKLDLG
jgi:hypothetical protein